MSRPTQASKKRKGADPNSHRQQKKRALATKTWEDSAQVDRWDSVKEYYNEYCSIRAALTDDEIKALLVSIEANEDASLEASLRAADEAVSKTDFYQENHVAWHADDAEGTDAGAGPPPANFAKPLGHTPASVDLVQKLMTSWYWAGTFKAQYESQVRQTSGIVVSDTFLPSENQAYQSSMTVAGDPGSAGDGEVEQVSKD